MYFSKIIGKYYCKRVNVKIRQILKEVKGKI